ncbi:iron complex outermembrane recepter protein [Mariniphaga anaerophila]|uniref:Iron complex outermembrane recepter protein n=1 Tax=Mariniphaga anaerophila TaxID=1484053 RepID=A0A1M4Y7R7_9BACT|nr:TonB-dependent receptor [Mariniphaga anaerophila]SHF01811.1 iron complex outermembrane recepter protein [Mariniphaga anaerophila]
MKRLSFWLLLQLMVIAAMGQYNLKGTIKGDGEPLPGASVMVENTFLGVSAQSDGSFEFSNLKKGKYTLKASFVGFETQELTVNVPEEQVSNFNLEPASVMTGEVLVSATRAKDKTPVAYTNITGEEIAERNMGQDIPYLLQLTPSFVPTSDAGAGVGYTNFRIRGTDLNRINVTVNGIPLNDAESHGTWFVDQPDLASSLENVQIQRGVGTSTNGAAAFGATINLQTNTLKKEPYAEYKTAGGSFNTFKNTVSAGSGLLNGKFTLDARLSKVNSDGFIDRASSDLKSFFVSGGYYSGNTVLKANIFSGVETTYQSWNGVPSVRLNNDLEGMQRYGDHWLYSAKQTEEMINSDSRTYNLYTYENQVDFYQQDHYQLHFSHKFSQELNLNASGFYTRGKGYYENFKEDDKLKKYQIPEIIYGTDTIRKSDLINRKWLDNHFYGLTFSLNFQNEKNDFTFGGGWNTYDGDHYGNVLWSKVSKNTTYNHEWYNNNGLKKDFNLFAKYNYQLAEMLNLFADVQYRRIDYTIDGIDDDLRDISQEHEFNFFNPKLGIFYQPANNQNLYLSFATANREPNRSAYIDNRQGDEPPVFETLYDWELGYGIKTSGFSGDLNFYFMNYKNQLVLTGEINDVGNAITANVDESYRAGMEIQLGAVIAHNLQWMGNATFSRNKIKNFTEYVESWDTGGHEKFELGTTNIAFSPNVVANSQVAYEPVKNLNFSFISSFVGKQYIDNSSNNDRSLDAYFVNNLKVDYSFKTNLFEEVALHFMVNNLFNEEYESNAWVYSYIFGGERYKMDGYFPQAGRHFMVGVDLKF